MKNIEALTKKVAVGEVRIIQAVGVPRSISTAIARSLNESGDSSIYVNEPLNRANASADIAATYILEELQAARSRTPTTVITKNMASYLDDESFAMMYALSEHTVWNVRDPYIQIGSLLTRVVNDLFVSAGASTLAQEKIDPFLEDACRFLVHSEKSQDYSKTGWKALYTHFINTEEAARGLVIDGQRFVDEPSLTLKALCGALDLSYSEKMESDWSNDFVNIVNRDHPTETMRSAWTQDAAISTGIHTLKREPLVLAQLPESLQEHMTEVALPAYASMLASSQLP